MAGKSRGSGRKGRGGGGGGGIASLLNKNEGDLVELHRAVFSGRITGLPLLAIEDALFVKRFPDHPFSDVKRAALKKGQVLNRELGIRVDGG